MTTQPQIDVKAPIAQLLAQLNAIRETRGEKPLKKWGGSRAGIVAAIAKSGINVTKAPTVVAKGAYDNDREALAKTGHTTNGKPKSQEKREARKAKAVEKATAKGRSANTSITRAKKADARARAETKREVPDDCFTLADWARDHDKEPKVARAKARRHEDELKKLWYKGTKHVFPNAKRKQVDAIMSSDHRAKEDE